MSDFDTVLERLLDDHVFAARLAANPAAALASYQLSPDEIELLSAQVTHDVGGYSGVEARTSQASMFGLLAPLAGAIGIGGAATAGGPTTGFGPAETSGFGAAERTGFGAAETSGFGAADEKGMLGGMFDEDMSAAIGDPVTDGHQGFGEAQTPTQTPTQAPTAAPPPPAGYHTRVDVDGDGDWDKHWYVGRADGGVDILADQDHDGRVDFVGHDFDRDGLVDAADYDKNRDGVLETHMFDDDGDGWMDRKIISPG